MCNINKPAQDAEHMWTRGLSAGKYTLKKFFDWE